MPRASRSVGRWASATTPTATAVTGNRVDSRANWAAGMRASTT